MFHKTRFAVHALYETLAHGDRVCGIAIATFDKHAFAEICLADFQRRYPDTEFAIRPTRSRD